MELTVCRSLDRSVQFFGIKGRFLIPMGIGAVTSLITACMIGSATNGLAGIALFLILFFAFANSPFPERSSSKHLIYAESLSAAFTSLYS